jgi:tRNA pseudouridine55 synthase
VDDEVNGVLVVDKPAGPTSHDVVALARRALGTSRIGHTGTLDPLATGVLPLVVGRATRLASLLSGAEKEYDAAVRLGLDTETYDAAHLSGPIAPPPAGIDSGRILAALEQFRGTFSQTPPAYSAKKINGVAAYKLARRNEPVQPRAVEVSVRALDLMSYEHGLARLRIQCSAGFYVRSLAHDLGASLGCGAHLETLRRTRAGAFDERSAVPLEDLQREGRLGRRWLLPVSGLLPHLPGVVLNDRGVRRASHGNDVAADDCAGPVAAAGPAPDETRWRLFDAAGMLLGIAERRPAGLLHPLIVLV